MDITPIFRPPTPPKAGFFFFKRFFSLILCLTFCGQNLLAKQKSQPEITNSSFLLFYQPLFEMSSAEAKAYVQQVRNLLKTYEEPNLQPVLYEKPNTTACKKKGLHACSQTLYLYKGCIPKIKSASAFCHKKAKQLPHNHFKEPVFNRIAWNRLAIALNYFCNQNTAKVCQPLAKLHDQYMQKHLAMMAQRQQEQEKHKASPFKKRPQNAKNK